MPDYTDIIRMSYRNKHRYQRDKARNKHRFQAGIGEIKKGTSTDFRQISEK